MLRIKLCIPHGGSDITGKTGMTIIRAIVDGERNPRALAEHRDCRCKRSVEDIAKSLKGNYRDEHLFSLHQAVELYDIYDQKTSACDKALEQKLKSFENSKDSDDSKPSSDSGKPQKKRKSKSSSDFDIRFELNRISGVDLTEIDGIDENTALKIVSEIGTDISRWPEAKHFGSWLGLCPGTKISGGKVLNKKTKRIPSAAATALAMEMEFTLVPAGTAS